MDLPKKSEDGRQRRNSQGKRFRTPEEFIGLCKEKGHPCCMVKIYNRKDKIVIEALKNMKTKHTHVLKLRRPTDTEEKEFSKLLTREQLMSGSKSRDQLEVMVGGDDYTKQPLKSR